MQTTHDHKSLNHYPSISEMFRDTWNSARGWVDKWIIEPARKRRMYRQTVEELQALDDRMLRDIGIARCQIHDIARSRAYGVSTGEPVTFRAINSAANDNRRHAHRRGRRSERPAALKAA